MLFLLAYPLLFFGGVLYCLCKVGQVRKVAKDGKSPLHERFLSAVLARVRCKSDRAFFSRCLKQRTFRKERSFL